MKHKTRLTYKLTLVILCLLISNGSILGQADMNRFRGSGMPVFHCDVVNVDSPQPEMSRLFIYIKIAFDELQFLREDSLFRAKYEVSVVIADKKNFQVDGKVWEEELTAKSYQQTNSRSQYSLTYEKFDLPPGDYKISIGLTDQETKKTRTAKIKVNVENFKKKKLAVSEITFVRNLQTDSLGVKSFSPEVADYIIDLTNKLYMYFEIYSQSDKDETFDISYEIKNAKGKQVYKNKYKRRKDARRTLEYFPLSNSELSQGPYVMKLNVRQGARKVETEKRFVIRWADMPSTISDIDLAIRQLKYIANKQEWKKLKKASSDEKLDKFKEFWKKRDPSPGTPANEWMDEYYNRIAYSNVNFSGFRDGWKSDMGMIFIIFGPPSDIDRHPFDSESKPYEIWYYYTINRQFLFMDETGFGEYRLLTTSWEDWRSLIRH